MSKLDAALIAAGTIAALTLWLVLWQHEPLTGRPNPPDLSKGITNSEKTGAEADVSGSSRTSLMEASYVRMTTSKGDIVIKLDPASPSTKNFLEVVRRRDYDHTLFHSVNGKAIRGGCFYVRSGYIVQKRMYDFVFQDPHDDTSNRRGTITMAQRSDDPPHSSQVFSIQADDSWNPTRGVFGHIIEGMSTVDAIRSVSTKQATLLLMGGKATFEHVPVAPVEIIEVVEIPAPAVPRSSAPLNWRPLPWGLGTR